MGHRHGLGHGRGLGGSAAEFALGCSRGCRFRSRRSLRGGAPGGQRQPPSWMDPRREPVRRPDSNCRGRSREYPRHYRRDRLLGDGPVLRQRRLREPRRHGGDPAEPLATADNRWPAACAAFWNPTGPPRPRRHDARAVVAHGAGPGVPPGLQPAGARRAAQHPAGEVGLDLTGVRDADHRVGVRARRTSVVYQARDRQGSAGVGTPPRRCAGPTASLRWAQPGTMTTFGGEPACPMLGRAC